MGMSWASAGSSLQLAGPPAFPVTEDNSPYDLLHANLQVLKTFLRESYLLSVQS